MKVRLTLLAVFLSMAVFLLFPRGVQVPTVTPVASVRQLHEAMISPSSDTLFNVGSEIPKDDEEWTRVRNNAILLAESGNLLMIGNRARDAEGWMKMSQELVDAGAAALKAAEMKNVDAVVEAGNEIVMVCEKCHEVYRDGRKMNAR